MISTESRFRSPADARGYAAELQHTLAHPEEEDLTEEQIAHVKGELFDIRQYLAECDESL